ncbi:hypothetical protein D3C81_1612560 [compost metagenome]
MGIEVVERQFLAVNDALAGELDVGIHRAPAISLELFHRQHFIGWLFAFAAARLLLVIGVSADQRCEVSEQQLIGKQ